MVAAILAVLAQMAFDEDARTQLLLSLLSWAIVVVLFFATKRLRGKAPAELAAAPGEPGAPAERVLVLANETVDGDELLDELRAIDQARQRGVLRLRPGQPDRHRTGDARRGGVRLAGHHRGGPGPAGPNAGDPAGGEPARATERSATTGRSGRWPTRWRSFKPDRLVICTHPEDRSAWLRYDVVDRAREAYDIPITHVIVESVPAGV